MTATASPLGVRSRSSSTGDPHTRRTRLMSPYRTTVVGWPSALGTNRRPSGASERWPRCAVDPVRAWTIHTVTGSGGILDQAYAPTGADRGPGRQNGVVFV